MNKFGERLKELRLERKISPKQLADDLKVSERLIYYWINGQRECNFDTLLKIAKYFNESTDFMLVNDDT